jgi:homotetrameric cytidine deaminase
VNVWDVLGTRSHVPYSGIPDMCIAVGHDGTWHPGVRIENASFPLTISATQAALFGCISEGAQPVALLLPPGASVDAALAFGYPAQTVASPRGRFADVRIDVSDPEPLFERLKARAVVPNSAFPVVALLQTDSGWVSGVNIETADWQTGLCAERVAMAKAVSHGLGSPLRWHIHAFKGDFISPCGACRQVMAEFNQQADVIMHHPDGSRSRHTVGQFLPFTFNGTILRK